MKREKILCWDVEQKYWHTDNNDGKIYINEDLNSDISELFNVERTLRKNDKY